MALLAYKLKSLKFGFDFIGMQVENSKIELGLIGMQIENPKIQTWPYWHASGRSENWDLALFV